MQKDTAPEKDIAAASDKDIVGPFCQDLTQNCVFQEQNGTRRQHKKRLLLKGTI